MLDFDGCLKLSGFFVFGVRCKSGGKSLPLVAPLLFCTTCGPQSQNAVCTYHIWHVLSLERSDWSVTKCCGLVFWATDCFLFPRPPNTPLIPLLVLLLHKQTHAFCPSWFLFSPWEEYFLLFSSTSIGTGYPRLSCSFYCSIFSRRLQSVWSDRLGTFPRLSACCTNSRCV